MAETILTGYLVNKINYDVFDEIITFLTPDGKKITCISKGSKKIESKNARNLFLGALIEFEIFQSRSEDKMSKLKKAHLTEKSNWNYEVLDTFNLLNELTTKIEQPKTNLYDFYAIILKLIKSNEYSEKQLILIILQKACHLLGINLQVNRCVRCNNNKLKTISFKDHGMLCNMCFNPVQDKLQDLDLSKLIHFLFNEKYANMIVYAHEWDYAIKLLKQFIGDNAGIFFYNSITTY